MQDPNKRDKDMANVKFILASERFRNMTSAQKNATLNTIRLSGIDEITLTRLINEVRYESQRPTIPSPLVNPSPPNIINPAPPSFVNPSPPKSILYPTFKQQDIAAMANSINIDQFNDLNSSQLQAYLFYLKNGMFNHLSLDDFNHLISVVWNRQERNREAPQLVNAVPIPAVPQPVIGSPPRLPHPENIPNRDQLIQEYTELLNTTNTLTNMIQEDEGYMTAENLQYAQDMIVRMRAIEAIIGPQAVNMITGSPPRVRSVPKPRPREEMVDIFAAAVELEDLFRRASELYNREVEMFGDKGDLLPLIRELRDDIEKYEMPFLEAEQGRRRPPKILLSNYLKQVEKFRNDLQELIDGQKNLGRRCLNEYDPYDQNTAIADVPDGMYIRMNNGMCWDIESLLAYLEGTKGRNDARMLKDYPTTTIWRDQQELQRILNHPVAIKAGFSKWYKDTIANLSSASRLISEETMNRMVIAASLMASRGQPFRIAVKKELTPIQYDAWIRDAQGNADNINYIRNKELRKDIELTVATTIKSNATAEFLAYYNTLSQDERDALGRFDPHLEKNLNQCYIGEFCQFGMSDNLLTVRNSIANYKGLGPIEFKNRFE